VFSGTLNPTQSINQSEGDSDVISSHHIYASCFPPWYRASCAKCFWHDFLSKIVIIRTSSYTNWFNIIQITRQIFTT